MKPSIMIRQTAEGFVLPVKATPRGGKDVVLPFIPGDDRVLVKVSAPPEDGKANQAVVELLAQVMGVSKSSVRVVSGETARQKRLLFVCSRPIEPVLTRMASAMGTTIEAAFVIHA